MVERGRGRTEPCGISPLGAGTPTSPAMNVKMPSRKKSQWKPGGLTSGNSDDWAIRDDTLWSNANSFVGARQEVPGQSEDAQCKKERKGGEGRNSR